MPKAEALDISCIICQSTLVHYLAKSNPSLNVLGPKKNMKTMKTIMKRRTVERMATVLTLR